MYRFLCALTLVFLDSQLRSQSSTLATQMANVSVSQSPRSVSSTLTPVQIRRKSANTDFAKFLIKMASEKRNFTFSEVQSAVDFYVSAYGSMVASLAQHIMSKIHASCDVTDSLGRPLTALDSVIPQLAFLLVHPDESPGLQYRLKQTLLDNHTANEFFHIYQP